MLYDIAYSNVLLCQVIVQVLDLEFRAGAMLAIRLVHICVVESRTRCSRASVVLCSGRQKSRLVHHHGVVLVLCYVSMSSCATDEELTVVIIVSVVDPITSLISFASPVEYVRMLLRVKISRLISPACRL